MPVRQRRAAEVLHSPNPRVGTMTRAMLLYNTLQAVRTGVESR